MVVPGDAGRAGGNGGVTLQLRYRSGTVPQPFLNRSAGTGAKLSPEAHRQQIAQRRHRYLRKCGNTGCARRLSCDRSQDTAMRGLMLVARIKMADASKSGCTSPMTRRCPRSKIFWSVGVEGVQLLDALLVLLVVAAPAPLCGRNSYAHQKASAPAGTCMAYRAAQHPGAPAYIPGNLVCGNEPGTRYAAKSVLWTSAWRCGCCRYSS